MKAEAGKGTLVLVGTPLGNRGDLSPRAREAIVGADLLLCSVGVLTDDALLDSFLDVMLRAPFRLCREAIGHMGPGCGIVNVTSTYAVIGGRRGGAYSAAKGGLTSLTEHIACDYGPKGIRANCVAPGVTMTDMVRHRFDDEMFKRVNVETTPFPRLGEVEDIASTIAFLCSPGAGFINGQTIVVDGGWTTTKYMSDRALRTTWVEPDTE